MEERVAAGRERIHFENHSKPAAPATAKKSLMI
jgi:hypothetical protein